MEPIKNEGAEWSVAYAVAVKRLDSQFMLCLLTLVKLPDLRHMHGDLVDQLHAICTLLAKRPMVGFLISRRLKLPVDKTFALLNVLLSKGYLKTVGANLADVNLDALSTVKVLNLKSNKNNKNNLDSNSKQATMTVDASLSTGLENKDKQSSGDVLNQLWRVLNTDIVMSKAARSKSDPKSTKEKEAGEVLSQLWQVLNSDIGVSQNKDNKENKDSKSSNENKQNKLNSSKVAIEEIHSDEHVLRDVNGHIIEQDDALKLTEKSTEAKSKAVMSQLWEVLNADIAFKRQEGISGADQSANEKSKEISDVMSQLWRVLNTEIAVKRQDADKNGADSVSDTTIEANDKLKNFWRILDAEITLKKQPTTHAMRGPLSKEEHVKANESSVEAVSRLSQFWQVLNADITLDIPQNKATK